VATDRRILVIGAHQDPELATGYLNAYRILVSDLVVLTMAELGSRHEELREAILEVKDVPVIATVLRPRPIDELAGRRVAFFSTAPEPALPRLREHLREQYGADVVHVSGNLAHRDRLREEVETVEADVYLVEIKAAAIDVVAETASDRGVDFAFADNDVLPLEGEDDLDAALQQLAAEAVGEPALR
jgi:cyclic 2,3-diphosphoglycerate synthetase